MKALESKGILILVSALGVFFGFGSLSLMSSWNQLEYSRKINESTKVLSLAQASLRSEGRSAARSELKEIQPQLEPSFRREAIGKLLNNPSRTNLIYLVDSEARFQEFAHQNVETLESRARTYGLMSLILAIGIFVGFAYWNRKRLFDPIKNLNSRMLDFLNDRYSYEFETPEQTELGQLTATFNMMAQRVLDQIEDLQSLDKAKSEFLSIASHELRTPLTSIKGSLSLLKGGVAGNLNDESSNLLGIALDETDRLIRLINDLLDLAKIEAGSFPIEKSWTSVRSVLQRAADTLGGYATTAKVEIQVVADQDWEVNIDKDRIQQVIANLTSNAIKYSPEEGVVELRAWTNNEGLLEIRVTDQGQGISPDDQAHIFEKFRQATSPENPLVKGTGLGLAIAKALVEEHKGRIGVESKPGQGSSFYFEIPEWRESAKQNLEAS